VSEVHPGEWYGMLFGFCRLAQFHFPLLQMVWDAVWLLPLGSIPFPSAADDVAEVAKWDGVDLFVIGKPSQLHGSIFKSTNKRTNERSNKRTNKQTNEQANKHRHMQREM
jgi:hypothetical protein